MTNDKYYADYYAHGFITEDNDETDRDDDWTREPSVCLIRLDPEVLGIEPEILMNSVTIQLNFDDIKNMNMNIFQSNGNYVNRELNFDTSFPECIHLEGITFARDKASSIPSFIKEREGRNRSFYKLSYNMFRELVESDQGGMCIKHPLSNPCRDYIGLVASKA